MSVERRPRKSRRNRLDWSAYTTFADLVAEFGVDDIAKTWDSRKFAGAMKHVPRRTEDDALCANIIKRIRNRESARRSREKRQNDLANLESQLEEAYNKITELKSELANVRADSRCLTNENARLWRANNVLKVENARILELAKMSRDDLAGRTLPEPAAEEEETDGVSSQAESPMTTSSSVGSDYCECKEPEPTAPLSSMSHWLDVVLNTHNPDG
jgi:hypothetical protein